jgi:hypothetical protein
MLAAFGIGVTSAAPMPGGAVAPFQTALEVFAIPRGWPLSAFAVVRRHASRVAETFAGFGKGAANSG